MIKCRNILLLEVVLLQGLILIILTSQIFNIFICLFLDLSFLYIESKCKSTGEEISRQ